MRRYALPVFFFLAALLFLRPQASNAASPAEPYLGKVLVDVSANGEAWYVNPRSHMRVYLGRPADALERFDERAVLVSFSNIVRLSATDGAEGEREYAAAVAGQVLKPNDLIGAPWYVDPVTGIRRRLATPSDAWEIMQDGIPVDSAVLASIPEEAPAEPRFVTAEVADVKSGTVIELADGSDVRLLSVEVPENPELQQAAVERLKEAVVGRQVVLERDEKALDKAGTVQRFIHAGDVNLSLDLIRYGLAFHAIAAPNYRHAEQLIVASIDAERHRYGFWNR